MPLALLGNALQTRRQIKQNSMRHLQHTIEWQLQELQLQVTVATVARGSLRFMSLSKQLAHYAVAVAADDLVCCNNSSRGKGNVASGEWGTWSGSTWGRQLSNGLIDFAFSRIFKFARRHFAMLPSTPADYAYAALSSRVSITHSLIRLAWKLILLGPTPLRCICICIFCVFFLGLKAILIRFECLMFLRVFRNAIQLKCATLSCSRLHI